MVKIGLFKNGIFKTQKEKLNMIKKEQAAVEKRLKTESKKARERGEVIAAKRKLIKQKETLKRLHAAGRFHLLSPKRKKIILENIKKDHAHIKKFVKSKKTKRYAKNILKSVMGTKKKRKRKTKVKTYKRKTKSRKRKTYRKKSDNNLWFGI